MKMYWIVTHKIHIILKETKQKQFTHNTTQFIIVL